MTAPTPGGVTVIELQSQPDLLQGGHVHTCPKCHEHVPCEDTCSSFDDMDLDDGTRRGAYVACYYCKEASRAR